MKLLTRRYRDDFGRTFSRRNDELLALSYGLYNVHSNTSYQILKGNEMSQSCALIRRNKGHFRVEGKVEGGRDDTDPVLAVLGCV